MKSTALLLLSSCVLLGCATTPPVVAPQPKPNAVLDKHSQTGSASRYLCKDDKVVRVVYSKPTKARKLKKIENISLTFNGTTGKLKSTVTESGKAYTSIHWHWVERVDGSATLTNAVGVILADVCVLQQSESKTVQ